MKRLLLMLLFIGITFAQNTDKATNQPSASATLYDAFETTLDNIRMNLTTSSFLKIDSTTNAIYTIDYEHHEIHEGDHYFIESFDTLASGDSLEFCVIVPDTTKRAHMIFEFSSQLLAQFYVYEGSTCTAGDTATAYNNDRNSSNTSVLTITTGGTVSAYGTLLEKQSFGSGTNPASARTGFGERNREIILKNNTTYTFLFISGANNNIVDYNASWYEHTPSN